MSPDPLQKNNVRVRGAGRRAMVLGHGLGTDQRAFEAMAAAFEDRFRIVLMDHVGFGGSDPAAYRESRHGTLQGYALDLLDVLDALSLHEVVYVGHSAGALIGTLASVEQPARFEQLVLLCMSPRFVNDPPGYHGGFDRLDIENILDLLERDQAAWAGQMAPLAMGEDGGADAVDTFCDNLRALDPVFARRFARLVFGVDIRPVLPRVQPPVLAVHCLHDSIVPPQVGHYLQRTLPHCTLRELPASGHCPHISHPAETIAALADHLHGLGILG